MRYTTIIDIRDLPQIWNNTNITRAYLYLCLSSGYHDTDRDLVHVSVRGLAALTGLSVAASRHALQQLQKAGLITRQGDAWKVTKFVITEAPATRPKTKREQQLEIERLRRAEEQRRRDTESAEKKRIQTQWTSAMEAAATQFGQAALSIIPGGIDLEQKVFVVIVKGREAADLMDRQDFREFARERIDRNYAIYPRNLK